MCEECFGVPYEKKPEPRPLTGQEIVEKAFNELTPERYRAIMAEIGIEVPQE